MKAGPSRGEPKEWTVQSCWTDIKPLCDDLLQHAGRAPLSPAHRAGLLTMVAMHVYGAAIAAQQRAVNDGRPISAVARDLMESIIEGLARGERPKIVSDNQQSGGGK